ncbi:CAP domain-containing protein [Anaerotignum sp.]|nr:CAP domain-containing protein [Anaerotignum sp.]MBQ7759251.1 hypothetical protein [Anaerotignum sp.]
MKKLFALALTAVMAFGMIGCGGSEKAAEETAMLTDEGAEEIVEDGIIIGMGDVPLAGDPDDDIHEYVYEVVELVNEERAAEGLAPLELDLTLCEAAQVRAEEAKTSFSHTRPNGSKCFTALADAGVSYQFAGENLAGKIKTPEKVVKAWMDSEGHRKNIMAEKYSYIGIGYVENGNYWAQFFIG